MAVSKSTDQPPGPGVDAQGRAVIDPTENVKALNDAAVRRQDDLREMQFKYAEKLADQQARYQEKIADLRALHQKEQAETEAKRLDAIRLVDQARATGDNAAAEVRATALAAQVALTADAARNSAASATQAQSENLTRVIAPLQAAIEDLRRAQYQQQGEKQQVITTRDTNADSRGANTLVIAGIGVFLTILIVILGVIAIYHK